MLHSLFLLGEIQPKIFSLRFIHLLTALQQPVGERFCQVEQFVVSVSLFLTGNVIFSSPFLTTTNFVSTAIMRPPYCNYIQYTSS
ncbi:Uncharacterised protein [Leclercia adecarboxylata]|uniref:Uncharacterized protein n=1 Tax=Leclercia adecarboxylata TaxID=83655 RepID=A0A4U9HVI2_9ENTR|nr:Uncharacterised protein [Leclercia adecarboxylata]